MKTAFRLASAFAVLLFASQTSTAQSPQDARITISHPGIAALKSDLKSLIDLTLPAEQTQWENLEGYVDTFAGGIDNSRPMYISAVTGIKPNAALFWVPLSNGQQLFKEFRENLESLGYEVTRDAKDTTVFQISQDPDYGFLKVHSDSRYAVFVLTNDKKTLPAFREIVLAAKLPTDPLKGSMSAEILNSDVSEMAQKHRREAFSEVRRVSLDAIKKRPEESVTEYELRRLAVKQQMDEGERLLAEGGRLAAVLTLDRKNPASPSARLTLSADAISGSSLADAIAQIGTQPDVFASIKKFEGSALSARLNHPIDPMRQSNILDFLALTEKDMQERIKGSSERSAPEKEISNRVTAGVLDVVRSSIKSGWINSFAESVPDGKGDFTSVAAFSAPDAAKLTAVLPELANAGKGNEVQMNVAQQGDVAIHRIRLAEGFLDLVDRVFGTGKDLYVGIGPQHVWLGSGVDGLQKLKDTIAGLGQPELTETPLHVELKLLPWVQRFDEAAKKAPPGKTPLELETQREWARRRARAIAAFQNGEDGMMLSFKVKDGLVTGELFMETGLLRFGGKMMSAFSKANFE